MGVGCSAIGAGHWGMWGGAGILVRLLGGLLWVGLLAALVLAAVWLVRQLGRQSQTAWAGDTPLDIATRRLAAGEITVSEFDEIAQRAQGQGRPTR